MQGGFKIQKSIHHINTIKEKNMIISTYEKKPFDKIVIHKKILRKYREEKVLNPRKASTKIIKINWKIKIKFF